MATHPTTPSGAGPSRLPFQRRKSLRLPSNPPPIPIPPSLLKSPYLNSPQSIFKRELSAPRLPSEQDELWLQDTVPLSSHSNIPQRKPTANWSAHVGSRSVEDVPSYYNSAQRPQPHSHAYPSPPSPLSPRLHQLPLASASRPAWLRDGQTKSATEIERTANQGYFPAMHMR